MKKEDFKQEWPLVGNGHIVEFLSKSIDNGKAAGSYIFAGPDNLGKTTVANFFARSLVCQDKKHNSISCGACSSCQQAEKGIHGDIHVIKREKDKKNISIEQVRDFIKILGMSSFLNPYKIGIIKHAESLSIEAFNALLKTLEEPKAKVIIILVTANTEVMPATIVSRSQVLRFRPVNSGIIHDYLIKKFKAPRSAAKDFSRLCLGRPAMAIKFLEDKDFYENYKKKAEVFFEFAKLDINNSFAAIESLMGREARGQESARLASRTIEVWQGLVRDMLLLEFNQGDLIQHQLFEKELDNIKRNFNVEMLLRFARLLGQAQNFIEANINPKLALENIAASA